MKITKQHFCSIINTQSTTTLRTAGLDEIRTTYMETTENRKLHYCLLFYLC